MTTLTLTGSFRYVDTLDENELEQNCLFFSNHLNCVLSMQQTAPGSQVSTAKASGAASNAKVAQQCCEALKIQILEQEYQRVMEQLKERDHLIEQLTSRNTVLKEQLTLQASRKRKTPIGGHDTTFHMRTRSMSRGLK